MKSKFDICRYLTLQFGIPYTVLPCWSNMAIVISINIVLREIKSIRGKQLIYFDVLLTVLLSIILAINQLNAQDLVL